MLIHRLVLAASCSLLATQALGGTVLKVNKRQDQAIVRLTPSESSEVQAGTSVSFESGGETVEAEVLGVSGRSAKLKILYGIDAIKEGQKVQLGKSEKKAKTEKAEKAAPKPEKPASEPTHATDSGSGGGSDFVLGAGGKGHPFMGDLRAPWVMGSPGVISSGNNVYGFINPAQLTRVERFAFAGGLEVFDAKVSSKNDEVKNTVDFNSQYLGATAVANIQAGVHIGITYGQDEIRYKSKTEIEATSTDDTSKGKFTAEQMIFLFGMPFTDKIAGGVEYAQISEKSKGDGSDTETTSYQILRPGVTYHTEQYEVGLKYSPPIDINETDGSAQHPRAWLLHAQYRLTDGTSAGGQVQHLHNAGISDDSTDQITAKLGAEMAKQAWGSWGLFGIYEQKSYMKKNLASPTEIPQLGLQALVNFQASANAVVGTGITYGFSEAKAKQGGEGTKLKTQLIDVFVAASYQP